MQLGIDFGTSNSSATLIDGNELIPLKEPTSLNFFIPSSIFIAQNGKIHVGNQANTQRLADFSSYRNQLKRYLGEATPFFLGNRYYPPIEAIAQVIRKIK